MNREAVALGTPAYTMFAGRLGAVDEKLIAEGRLRRAYAADDVTAKKKSRHVVAAGPRDPQMFVDEILAVARRRWAKGAARPGDMMPGRVSGGRPSLVLRTGLQAIPEARVRDRLFVSRHRIWQIVTDAVLASAALYLAYLLRFNFDVPDVYLHQFLWIWAFVVACRAALLHRPRPLQQVVALLGRARPGRRLPGGDLRRRRRHGRRRPRRAQAAEPTSTAAGTTSSPPTASRSRSSSSTGSCCFLLHGRRAPGRRASTGSGPGARSSRATARRCWSSAPATPASWSCARCSRRDKIRYRPVGFVDDDPQEEEPAHPRRARGGHHEAAAAAGRGVLGRRGHHRHAVGQRPRRSRTSSRSCKKANAPVKTLPGVYELIKGSVTIEQLRDVQVEDILGRREVSVDYNSLGGYLEDRVVLVTGAGGSIGSELCRQIAAMNPRRLLLRRPRRGRPSSTIHARARDRAPRQGLPCRCSSTSRTSASCATCSPRSGPRSSSTPPPTSTCR